VIDLKIEPLTRAAFAPFGDVISTDGVNPLTINQGFAQRFDDLTSIDVSDNSGQPKLSLFEANPRPSPIFIELMERHPFGSQTFYPLQNRDWLIVVCENPLNTASFKAFRASGTQGITYAKNVWHHPLLVLDQASRFLIIDRKGPGKNLEEVELQTKLILAAP
jgi:ureidoglycolate lyase